MLSTYIKNDQKDWDNHLKPVLMAYRTSIHSSTLQSPFFLMYGRDPKLPIHCTLTPPTEQSIICEWIIYKVTILSDWTIFVIFKVDIVWNKYSPGLLRIILENSQNPRPLTGGNPQHYRTLSKETRTSRRESHLDSNLPPQRFDSGYKDALCECEAKQRVRPRDLSERRQIDYLDCEDSIESSRPALDS